MARPSKRAVVVETEAQKIHSIKKKGKRMANYGGGSDCAILFMEYHVWKGIQKPLIAMIPNLKVPLQGKKNETRLNWQDSFS